MVEFKAILSVEEAIAAVKRDGYAMQYVPDELKTEAVVLAAVKHYGYALQHVPDELKTEAVVLAAVKHDGEVLRYVPDELKTEAVVLAAVESDGDMLRYVFEKSLFLRLAERFEIPINIKDPAVIVKSPQAR